MIYRQFQNCWSNGTTKIEDILTKLSKVCNQPEITNIILKNLNLSVNEKISKDWQKLPIRHGKFISVYIKHFE